MTVVRRGAGTRTIIKVDGKELRWATVTYVPQELLDANKRKRAMNLRSLPDSKGGWQQIANLPAHQLYKWIPQPVDWQDWKYLAKKLNDADHGSYRTDGDHRRA